jgi:hypothetical protein
MERMGRGDVRHFFPHLPAAEYWWTQEGKYSLCTPKMITGMRTGMFFLNLRANTRVVDLTACCGGMTLGMLTLAHQSHVTAYDINPDHVECTRRNLLAAGIPHQRTNLFEGDAELVVRGQAPAFDVAMCDPAWGGVEAVQRGAPLIYPSLTGGMGMHCVANAFARTLISVPQNFNFNRFYSQLRNRAVLAIPVGRHWLLATQVHCIMHK